MYKVEEPAMTSPAVIITSAEDEDGTNGVVTKSCGDIVQPVVSQEDAVSLIENLQSQAENISYEIEKIVGVHNDDENGKTWYQVRLVAYSWIPKECLGAFQNLIKDFQEQVQSQSDVGPEVSTSVGDCAIISVKQDDSCQDGDRYSDNDEDEEEEDDNEDYAEKDSAAIIKQESLPVDNHEGFPLPTAFMVTVGTADAGSEGTGGSGKQTSSSLHCDKCQQRFFLKSNLEVHVLFCKGNGSTLPRSPSTEGIEVTVNTEEVDSSLTGISSHQLNVFSEDQTFEYVPLDSDSTRCTTCTQRLPEGAMVGDSLTDLAQLVSHSRMRDAGDDIEIYECDECDREFLYKYPMKRIPASWLEKPINTPIVPTKNHKIENDRSFRCSICNRGFETEIGKAKHEDKHASTQSRYSCASCGEKFVTRNMLQDHYDGSTNCQPTKCELCGRTFVHSSHLKRHLSIHAGIKPFACSICEHAFNQRSDLLRHEKKHIVNDTYVCLKCQQDFPSANDLKEHIESHKIDENTKKVYSCPRCDKVFGRRSHFKRHITIHDGIKPHSCDKCGKCFNQRTDLKRHELSHVRKELKLISNSVNVKKESNTTCLICNKVFTSRVAFIEHDLLHQKIMASEKIMSGGVM